MSILDTVENTIEKWGSDIKIYENGQTVESRGVIQPLRYKNNMYLGGKRLDGGFYDGGHYLFIGDNSVDFEKHDKKVLECRNEKYIIKRAEHFSFDNEGI